MSTFAIPITDLFVQKMHFLNSGGWWAIAAAAPTAARTTVGFGDISPRTRLGRAVGSVWIRVVSEPGLVIV